VVCFLRGRNWIFVHYLYELEAQKCRSRQSRLSSRYRSTLTFQKWPRWNLGWTVLSLTQFLQRNIPLEFERLQQFPSTSLIVHQEPIHSFQLKASSPSEPQIESTSPLLWCHNFSIWFSVVIFTEVISLVPCNDRLSAKWQPPRPVMGIASCFFTSEFSKFCKCVPCN
jgi:hypothetical protein